MRLEQSFDVPAQPAHAWKLINDVPRVIPCMPGTELTEVVDDDTFKAKMHLKLGPVALQFATDISREQVDAAARRVVLSAKARELKGRGGAEATIESTMAECEGGTRVSVVTELVMQGAMAQYGRGIVGDVAAQLTKQFAQRLAAELTESENESPNARRSMPEVKPVRGVGLLFDAFWSVVLRLLRRAPPDH